MQIIKKENTDEQKKKEKEQPKTKTHTKKKKTKNKKIQILFTYLNFNYFSLLFITYFIFVLCCRSHNTVVLFCLHHIHANCDVITRFTG